MNLCKHDLQDNFEVEYDIVIIIIIILINAFNKYVLSSHEPSQFIIEGLRATKCEVDMSYT